MLGEADTLELYDIRICSLTTIKNTVYPNSKIFVANIWLVSHLPLAQNMMWTGGTHKVRFTMLLLLG